MVAVFYKSRRILFEPSFIFGNVGTIFREDEAKD